MAAATRRRCHGSYLRERTVCSARASNSRGQFTGSRPNMLVALDVRNTQHYQSRDMPLAPFLLDMILGPDGSKPKHFRIDCGINGF
jgi:hypothetical protein